MIELASVFPWVERGERLLLLFFLLLLVLSKAQEANIGALGVMALAH